MLDRRIRSVLAALALLSAACGEPGPTEWLDPASEIAPGVQFFRSTDATLVEPEGPIAVHLLRLDPRRVRIASVLSNDDILGAERVDAIAARHDAVAAVNGGFFNVRTGEPVGVLKVARELVSDTGVTKGAVVIRSPASGTTELFFDRVAVRMWLSFRAGGRVWRTPVNGVDTTRERGKLMLYSPAYHEHTDTAANGIEWALRGDPLTVVGVRRDAGETPIPRDGAVLSYGGLDPPEALAALAPGVAVALDAEWRTRHGLAREQLDGADHIVQGAGLIRHGSLPITDWPETEGLNRQSFVDTRHPRTLIGVARDGFIWLAAIDGRADHSVGMTFADLARLADRLDLTEALNLDGGGSTTMVVRGQVVNRPSDPTGPRAVSDALIVTLR